MTEAIKKFEEIIKNVEADIEEASKFRYDLYSEYSKNPNIEEMIKIQSMILKISDFISQKRAAKVELERQKAEYENELKGE